MRGAPVFAHTRLREGFCETFVRRKPLLLVTAPNDEHRVNVRKSWRSSSNHTEGYVLFQWIQKRATQREMLCEEKYKSYFYLLSMDNILSPSLNIVRHWSFAIDFLASFFPTHRSRVNKTIFWPMTEKKKLLSTSRHWRTRTAMRPYIGVYFTWWVQGCDGYDRFQGWLGTRSKNRNFLFPPNGERDSYRGHVLSSLITEVEWARVDARSVLEEQVAIQVFAGGL